MHNLNGESAEKPVLAVAGRRRLTPAIKVQVFQLVVIEGVTITAVAQQLGVHRSYLSRVVNRFRREYQLTAGRDIQTLVEELKPKCLEAIMAALTDGRSPYRSAAIALRVLKEMGFYKDWKGNP
jgi:transposase-like protein